MLNPSRSGRILSAISLSRLQHQTLRVEFDAKDDIAKLHIGYKMTIPNQ